MNTHENHHLAEYPSATCLFWTWQPNVLLNAESTIPVTHHGCWSLVSRGSAAFELDARVGPTSASVTCSDLQNDRSISWSFQPFGYNRLRSRMRTRAGTCCPFGCCYVWAPGRSGRLQKRSAAAGVGPHNSAMAPAPWGMLPDDVVMQMVGLLAETGCA